MTEVGTVESLNLDELRELVKLARHRLTVHPSDGWAADFADNVPALVAEVERLRAQRDEALEVAKDAAHPPIHLDDDERRRSYAKAINVIAVVLSRTEDGIQPRSYYDVVRSMTADPDVLAAVDKTEAEDGTNG